MSATSVASNISPNRNYFSNQPTQNRCAEKIVHFMVVHGRKSPPYQGLWHLLSQVEHEAKRCSLKLATRKSPILKFIRRQNSKVHENCKSYFSKDVRKLLYESKIVLTQYCSQKQHNVTRNKDMVLAKRLLHNIYIKI